MSGNCPIYTPRIITVILELVKGGIKGSTSLTSINIEEANDNAKPANDAETPGVKIARKAVTPTTALDSKLNRMESQRLTA